MTQGLRPTRWRLTRSAGLAALAATAVMVMETRGVGQTAGPATPADAKADVRFMTLDPGHFHAALVQKEMYPGVSPQVDVYAPLGPDLLGHLARVSAYNLRPASPTAWRLDVHTGPDSLARMLREKPGNVVVLSGRNAGKIERVGAAVEAGLNVLVDKPWILASADLPKVASALEAADRKGLIAYDIMTERFEASNALQRALVMDPAVFGDMIPGTPAEPGVYIESVHHLMKVVSGAPNIRPTWFFDVSQQGEGFNDIGTHLVDLVQWTLSPARVVDAKTDVKVLDAYRWPTMIPEADFRRVTGTAGFPEALTPRVKDGVARVLLQHLRHLHAARRPRLAQRDLGLGSAGRRRRLALRRLSRHQGPHRGAPDQGRRLQARGLHRAGPRRGRAGDPGRGQSARRRRRRRVAGRRRRDERRRDQARAARRAARRPRGALRPGHVAVPELPARPQGAAGLGTAEHARQVHGDDRSAPS